MGTDRPGPLDLTIVILSPLIVAVLTMVFLVGWWVEGLWKLARGEDV